MNRNFFKIVRSEAPMDPVTELELDVLLDSASQLQVAEWVGSLPEDSPSLEWRSRLNERLMTEAKTPRRPRRFFVWAGSTGLVVAAAIAGVVVFWTPSAEVPSAPASVEAQLVAAHLECASSVDMNLQLEQRPTQGDLASPIWTEADFEAL